MRREKRRVRARGRDDISLSKPEGASPLVPTPSDRLSFPVPRPLPSRALALDRDADAVPGGTTEYSTVQIANEEWSPGARPPAAARSLSRRRRTREKSRC